MTTTTNPAAPSQTLSGPFAVDANHLTLFGTGTEARQKMAYAADGTSTGKQQTDDNGVPLWIVEVYDGAEGASAAPVRITVAAKDVPQPLARFSPVRLSGAVTVRPYVQAGRISFAVKAGGIRPA
jgi:hypothetical protein